MTPVIPKAERPTDSGPQIFQCPINSVSIDPTKMDRVELVSIIIKTPSSNFIVLAT